MKGGSVVAGGLALVMGVMALAVAGGAGSSEEEQQLAAAPGGGGVSLAGSTLNAAAVPAEYVALVDKAGKMCPTVTAPLLAAQLETESSWNPNAQSVTVPGMHQGGAQGIAQFMPGTWAAYGRDENGDGKADPFDPVDAIPAQARYECEIATQLQTALTQGRITGDITELMLAGYNAGPDAVLRYGGVPPYAETQSYVKKIPALATEKYTAAPAPTGTGEQAPLSGSFPDRVIQAAQRWVGTTYAWGGGDFNGPTLGIRDGGVADRFGDYNKTGFDCSGLVLHAVYQASGGQTKLPHLADAQRKLGQSVPLAAIQPGDVIAFSSNGGASFHHIGIYVGNGQLLNAPQSGSKVSVMPLANWSDELSVARRFG